VAGRPLAGVLKILGTDATGDGFPDRLWHIVTEFDDTCPVTLSVGVFAVAVTAERPGRSRPAGGLVRRLRPDKRLWPSHG
jgi:hypothetical protein